MRHDDPTLIGQPTASSDDVALETPQTVNQAADSGDAYHTPVPKLSFTLSRRIYVCTFAVWTALCSGTAYGISAYQIPLIEHYGFTGADTGLCFTLAFLLNVFEPGGVLFAMYGSRFTVIYGGVFVAIGLLTTVSVLQILTSERWAGHADVWLLALGFGALAQGSSCMYTTGLFSTIYFWEGSANQGMVIGFVAAGFGLSAALWVGIYSFAFPQDLRAFFVFLGCVYSTTILCFACSIFVPPPSTARRLGSEKVKFMEAGDEASPVADDHVLEDSSSQLQPQRNVCCTILKNPAVFLFAASFALIQGSAGGVVLGNASLIARAFGASENQAQSVVSLFSIANSSGRVGIGVVMDCCNRTSKPMLLLMCGLVVCIASFLLGSLGNVGSLPLSCLLIIAIGLAYGALWAILPAHGAAELGAHNSGIAFMASAACVAPISSLFAMLTDTLYDLEAESLAGESTSHVCIGGNCFRVALLLCTAACGVAMVIAWLLHRRIQARDDAAQLSAETSGAELATPRAKMGENEGH